MPDHDHCLSRPGKCHECDARVRRLIETERHRLADIVADCYSGLSDTNPDHAAVKVALRMAEIKVRRGSYTIVEGVP